MIFRALRSLTLRPQPEVPALSVSVTGQPVSVRLRRREAARRMTLRVSGATRDVVLTLPVRTDLKAAQRFLDAHAGWIAARLARMPERVAFLPGNVVPVRGEPHRILHVPGSRGTAHLAADETGGVIQVPGPDATVPGRVRRLLRSEAERELREAVARHAGRLGVPYRRVTVRDTVSRWGSCSSTGALSFSWRLIMAPPHVLDYLAAHEVAHLREMNHSHRFWSILRDLCPATDTAEAWLKRHGTDLYRYGEG